MLTNEELTAICEQLEPLYLADEWTEASEIAQAEITDCLCDGEWEQIKDELKRRGKADPR